MTRLARFGAIAFAFPAALCALAACTPGGDRSPWGSGQAPGLCSALQEKNPEPVMLSLSRLPGNSGIHFYVRALRDVWEGVEYPDAVLVANGERVRARAIGVVHRGRPGIFFVFNPRRLIRDHPEGLSLEVLRRGKPVYATSLRGTAAAFRDLQDCDRGLLMQTGPAKEAGG